MGASFGIGAIYADRLAHRGGYKAAQQKLLSSLSHNGPAARYHSAATA
jgi:hypothetical protein